MNKIEGLEKRVADLEHAIREANDCLKCNEGVGLLYYMDDYPEVQATQEAIKTLVDLLGGGE